MINNLTTINAQGQPALAGNVVLVPGANVTLSQSGQQITVNAAGGGGLTLTTIEVDLGTTKRTGKFNITSSGLTVGKPVLVVQANGPYTNKGTLSDEAEVDALTISGKVTSATNIECFWKSLTSVKGNFKFDYAVSA